MPPICGRTEVSVRFSAWYTQEWVDGDIEDPDEMAGCIDRDFAVLMILPNQGNADIPNWSWRHCVRVSHSRNGLLDLSDQASKYRNVLDCPLGQQMKFLPGIVKFRNRHSEFGRIFPPDIKATFRRIRNRSANRGHFGADVHKCKPQAQVQLDSICVLVSLVDFTIEADFCHCAGIGKCAAGQCDQSGQERLKILQECIDLRTNRRTAFRRFNQWHHPKRQSEKGNTNAGTKRHQRSNVYFGQSVLHLLRLPPLTAFVEAS